VTKKELSQPPGANITLANIKFLENPLKYVNKLTRREKQAYLFQQVFVTTWPKTDY